MDQIIIGVDTHKSNHVAVAINTQGARLGSVSVPATSQGYLDLEKWAEDFGPVKAFGIEGTGSYGGGLSRSLLSHDQIVTGGGALGFWKALGEIFPKTKHQRCWVHKVKNVLNHFPKTNGGGGKI